MTEKIRLWSNDKTPDTTNESYDISFQPYIETFLLNDGQEHPMIIVFPGGAYACRAAHEANPIAERFNKNGFHSCVCHYRVSPFTYPAPQEDALRAIKIVRANAKKWKVQNNAVLALGFSAGGHLACSTGIIWDEVECSNGDEIDNFSARPDGTILCYPVITAVPSKYANIASFENLLGVPAGNLKNEYTDDELKTYSWDYCVRKDTPPSYIWHCAEDDAVPIYNSLSYAKALADKGVNVEMHIFARGGHGVGLADAPNSYPETGVWPELCSTWVNENFKKK